MTPDHNVTLAFTRMLAGPMDYTPGGFNNVTSEQFEPRNGEPMVRERAPTSWRCTWFSRAASRWWPTTRRPTTARRSWIS